MRKTNKNSINLYLFGFLLLLISLSLTNRSEALMSCMPTCSSVDSRFVIIVVGTGFETLTTETLNLRIVVPGDQTEFTFGIFDGDSEPGLITTSNWDAGVPFLYTYTLKIDPDEDDNGIPVFEEVSTNLPNNAWADFTLPTSDER